MSDRRSRTFTWIKRSAHGQQLRGAHPQPATDLANWMAGKSYMIVPLAGFDQRMTYLLMESGPAGEALLPLSFGSLDQAMRAKAEMEEALAVDTDSKGERGARDKGRSG
ncbi:hypothetical protein [Plastoroseomonas hellenica]|uniref:hypothetical protein n=1 Tax=Plastoroseomonas hellenica TaxID=2687306 RepID=UPI001BA76D95|nr:hypothetical protein [Plastoroseomonas hellenica]MBR0641274.1 hypothetical protein [Plastoroseomonas hellenica]